MTSNTSSVSFTVSNKGNPLLILNDFVYRVKKETVLKKYWICGINGCNAYIHTNIQNAFLKSSGEHNHLSDPEALEIKLFRDKLKQRAVHETTAISKIYEEEVVKSQFSIQVLANLLLAREIQPGLTHARRLLTPVLPLSSLFDIPDSYQITLKYETFLFSDSLLDRRKRMLLFGSVTQLEILFDSSTILMDGTFSTTPPFFDQVFTIHALKYETSNRTLLCLSKSLLYFLCFPCIFGVLPDRKRTTYQHLFKILKGLAVSMNRTFKPARVMSDYEASIITAVVNEFSQAIHSGCSFHFTQAIYRRIQSLGLITSYSQDSDIRICCRKLMALALLPIDQIETSFYNLRTKSSAAVKQELHQLFLYFNHQWITNVPMKMWSVHGYQHRTNNNCEGFHNRLNQRILKAHPNIWTFIKCIQNEENRFRHLLLQMNAGAQARKKTAATSFIQKRIDTLNERYKNGEIDVDQLLDGFSLTIAKQKK
ncbi:unnamed protein product [Rotaria socialis]|uniref:MULE transposase domain-containing protein n=1 Tax=Rotaria socialis TaxID=392032 RepID=A0A817W7R7_9BILA|nr:unnamed protein product [Rotaria socialis]